MARLGYFPRQTPGTVVVYVFYNINHFCRTMTMRTISSKEMYPRVLSGNSISSAKKGFGLFTSNFKGDVAKNLNKPHGTNFYESVATSTVRKFYFEGFGLFTSKGRLPSILKFWIFALFLNVRPPGTFTIQTHIWYGITTIAPTISFVCMHDEST